MRAQTAAVLLACAVFATPARAQGAEGVAGFRDLPAALEAYTSVLKAKANREGTHDGEAIQLMGKIMAGFAKLPDKDKRKVVKTLADAFRFAKRAPTNAKLYEDAVQNLSRTGELGAPALRKLFAAKRIAKGPGKIRKQWYPLRARILVALGKCRDKQTAGFLLDVALKNAESDQFLAAAGQALGNFEGGKEALRKQIAKKLIRELNRVFNLAHAPIAKPDNYDIQTPTFRRRLAAIQGPWNRTLRRLTRQSLSKPPEWQRFWNKNKSKPWGRGKSERKRR